MEIQMTKFKNISETNKFVYSKLDICANVKVSYIVALQMDFLLSNRVKMIKNEIEEAIQSNTI